MPNLFIAALMVLLFPLAGRHLYDFMRGGSPARQPFALVMFLAPLAPLVGTVFVDQIWLSFTLWSLANWLFAWGVLLQRRDGQQQPGRLVALLSGLASDLLIVVGLLALQSTGTEMTFSGIALPESYASLSSLDQAFWALAANGVLAGVAIRSALFPFQIWVREFLDVKGGAATLVGGLLPMTGAFLFHFSPLFSPFVEIRQAMIGIGGLTLVLAGILAFGQLLPDRRHVYVMISMIGLLWIGAGAGADHYVAMFKLVVVGAFSLSVQIMFPNRLLVNRILTGFLILVLGSGAWGQQQLFSSLAGEGLVALAPSELAEQQTEPAADQLPTAAAISPVALYSVPVGLLLLCLHISFGLYKSRDPEQSLPSKLSFIDGLLVAGCLGFAMYVLLAAPTLPSLTWSSFKPGITTLALLGIPFAWIASLAPVPTGQWIQTDLYASSLLQATVTVPFQLCCLIVRHLDALAIERSVFGIWRQATRVVVEGLKNLQSAQDEHADIRWSWALLTVLVLSLATLL